MNIKIFMQTVLSDQEHSVLIHAAHGLNAWAKLNNSVVSYEYNEGYVDCDVAIMMGSWKPRDKGHHAVRTSVARLLVSF